MGWFYRIVVLLLVVGIVGGGIFLMTWDIPPPSASVEKIIPNDTFTD